MSSRFINTLEGRKELQTALNEHGFQAGEVDGVFGPQTSRAIINARIAYKLRDQDKAELDTDLERSLGLLAIQSPEVRAVGTSLISIFLSILTKGAIPMNLPQIVGWLNNSTILGLLRNALLGLGAVLETHGWIASSADWEKIVGAIIIIVSTVLSGISNQNKAQYKAVAQAVEDHPKLEVVPAGDGKARVLVNQ